MTNMQHALSVDRSVFKRKLDFMRKTTNNCIKHQLGQYSSWKINLKLWCMTRSSSQFMRTSVSSLCITLTWLWSLQVCSCVQALRWTLKNQYGTLQKRTFPLSLSGFLSADLTATYQSSHWAHKLQPSRYDKRSC